MIVGLVELLQWKVVFTKLHLFQNITIHVSDWYTESLCGEGVIRKSADGKFSSALQNVTPFINVIFHSISFCNTECV